MGVPVQLNLRGIRIRIKASEAGQSTAPRALHVLIEPSHPWAANHGKR